jgi:exopolyphosphatase / guanosine-5'-triphosphate,3'-diphosphate pyrophosphatase
MNGGGPVAVVDIGSNSIKVLVLGRGDDGRLVSLLERTLEARISAGISRERPALGEEGMDRGVAAVRALLGEAAPLKPRVTVVVATSAVRDAGNGAAFCERIRRATGHDVRILSGDEEARLIGAGLLCDPGLAGLRDFRVFDLGGGSLEILSFADRRLVLGRSLPLGCVRLAERFGGDLGCPLGEAARADIDRHVRGALSDAGLLGLPPGTAVGTGGTLATVRRVLAAGAPLAGTPAIVPVTVIESLLARLGALTLAQRRATPGLPPERADVFPAALAILLALARGLGIAQFHHSLYNLRWGLAAEALGPG